MNELATIGEATAIASHITSMAFKLGARMDTGDIRKAGNKLGYSIKAIGDARQFASTMRLGDEDMARVESLLDAFTSVACNDIMKSLEKW